MFFWIIYEFSFVFGWISREMDQMSKNLGNCGGLTPRHSDPMQRRRPTPRRGMPCRSVACQALVWPAMPQCGREKDLASLGYAAA